MGCCPEKCQHPLDLKSPSDQNDIFPPGELFLLRYSLVKDNPFSSLTEHLVGVNETRPLFFHLVQIPQEDKLLFKLT